MTSTLRPAHWQRKACVLGVSASSSSPGTKRPPSDMTVIGMGVQAQAPADLVDVVDGLVGDVAAGEVRDPVPAVMVEAAVLDHLGRARPRRPSPGPAGTGRGLVLAQVAAHLVGHAAGHVELADHALLELLHPFADVRAGAVLGADLHHALVLAGRLDHLAAFPDAPGGRLLDVHVLARLAGPDRLQGVPVVLRGEADRVDRLVVEQLALVGVDV